VAEAITVGRDQLLRIPPRPTPRPARRLEAERQEARSPARTIRSFTEFLPMSIFTRTRDIFAANFTDLLDKAEDPAKMIRMIILEMEETLVEVRSSAARTIADQKEMRRQIMRLEQIQENWTEKAELALSRGREDLAKAALTEKQRAADMAASIGNEIAALDEGLKASEMYAGAKTQEAFSRFDVLERRADYAEGQAEALALAAPPRSLDEEIADLRNAEKVDAELEALKARLAAAAAN
jgi:phage shock protein A